MYPKALLLMVGVLASAAMGATVPLNGDFDIDHVPGDITGISIDPIPWNDPDPDSPYSIYFNPYATPDYTKGYAGNPKKLPSCNLAWGELKQGRFAVLEDYGTASGDLAIRVYNFTDKTVTFMDTVVTLNLENGALDVYLPEFTFGSTQNIHFWIGSDGSSYYANSSHGAGDPDMSAAESIGGGHLAMVPEPATMILLAGGSIVFMRKRKA